MKVKIDENLSGSPRASSPTPDTRSRMCTKRGSEVHATTGSGRICADGKLLVTLDHDFSDVRHFPPGSHPGILLLRTAHPSLSMVSSILRRVLDEHSLETLARCLAVADESRTRVRRPGDWRPAPPIFGSMQIYHWCKRLGIDPGTFR